MKSADKLSRLMPPLAGSNPIRHHRGSNTPAEQLWGWSLAGHQHSHHQVMAVIKEKAEKKKLVSGFTKILFFSLRN